MTKAVSYYWDCYYSSTHDVDRPKIIKVDISDELAQKNASDWGLMIFILLCSSLKLSIYM